MINRLHYLLLVVFIFLLAVRPLQAEAAPVRLNGGGFDPSFGVGGVLSLNGPIGEMNLWGGSLIQPNGKIVIAGYEGINSVPSKYLAVARILVDGSPDPDFGNQGYFKLSGAAYQSCIAYSIALQPDGKILAGGICDSMNKVIVRLTTEGTLDQTFGTNGVEYLGYGNQLRQIMVLPDGKILVGASCGTLEKSCISRLFEDGSLDVDFGDQGSFTFEDNEPVKDSIGVLFDRLPNGKIAVVELYYSFILNDYASQFALLDGNGIQDPDFLSGNVWQCDCYLGAVLAQPDSKILLAGRTVAARPQEVFLRRLNPDGSADGAFQTLPVEMTGVGRVWKTLALQRDQKILTFLMGKAPGDVTSPNHAQLVRLTPDGSFDMRFGSQGVIHMTTSIGSFGRGILVQPDGKIIVFFEEYHNTIGPITLKMARLLPGLPPTLQAGEFIEQTFTHFAATYDFNLLAEEIDSDPLTWTISSEPAYGTAWVSGNELAATVYYTPNRPTFPGADSFSIQVSDADGSDTVTVHIEAPQVSQPPVLTPISDQTVVEGQVLSFLATASDIDTPTNELNFTLQPILPEDHLPTGASIQPDGTFTWTPSEAQGPGSYTMDVLVSDETSTDSETLTITVSEANQPPQIDPLGAYTLLPGDPLEITLHGSDDDVPAQTLSFAILNPPTGMAFDPLTRTLTWIPNRTQAGLHAIAISLSDGIDAVETSLIVDVLPTWQIMLPVIFRTEK